MKKLVTAILLYFVSLGIAEAQSSYLRTREVRRLPNCTEATRGTVMSVRDATDQSTLGAGGGTAATVVICNTTWTPIASTVSNIDGDPSIVLDTDAAGSDITFTPVDDLVATAGDDITITAGGTLALDGTASLTLSGGGAPTLNIEDDSGAVSINSVGDVILTSTAGSLALGGTTTVGITAEAAFTVATTAGAVGITAGGTTEDITLTSVDDVILVATDDTTVAGDTMTVGTTAFVVDAGGSADEITVSAGEILVAGKLNNTVQSETCTAGGGTAALTITPTQNVIAITNSDADGCDITMSETGADSGQVVHLVVISNAGTTVNFADSAGVTELAGAFAADVEDSITLVYVPSRWVELGRSNN